MAESGDAERVELTTFTTKTAYVYLPIPPAPSYGHRAELWNVDKWFKEVKLRVVSAGDELYIRLEDLETGELFAECPLPSDGSPLTRAVEPVIDSSRYYVLRVVDREDHKKHAFLGVGFRERHESSNFSAALDDYRQYLRRKAEAEAMRQASDANEQVVGEGQEGEGPVASGGSHGSKYALQQGQTISIKLPTCNSLKSTSSNESSPRTRSGGGSDRPRVQRAFSLNDQIAGVRISIPPPPPPSTGLSVRTNSMNSGSPLMSPSSTDWAVFSDTPTGSAGRLSMRASGEFRRVDDNKSMRHHLETQNSQNSQQSQQQSLQGTVSADEWGDFQ